jgi:hypothetical protein
LSDPIISEAKLEGALTFLAETDATYAASKADTERAEILRKRTRARVFLAADGNNEERKAKAEVHADVEAADDVYCACLKQFETLKAKRERADIVVRVFQTLEATRRARG